MRAARAASLPRWTRRSRVSPRATAALGLDYAGVDLIPDLSMPGETGVPLVLEVNGVAAWRGLQSVTTVDIAAALVDDLLDRKLAASRASTLPLPAVPLHGR